MNTELEQLVAQWRKLDADSRRRLLDLLIQLQESDDLEKELIRSDVHISSVKTTHQVINGSCTTVDNLPQADILVTSPPYNAGIKYDLYDDSKLINEYLDLLTNAFGNCDRFLKNGGRCIVNVRDVAIGQGRRYCLTPFFWRLFCEQLGYFYRGTHIWYKGREESSTAWGSWCSSTNPSIIDLYEYVYVFQKGLEYSKGNDDISKTEFIESVIGVWKIRPVKKIFKDGNKLGHPCPFPVELVARAIRLYSHVGDTVLDPFAGILSTAVAAAKTGRNSISIELSQQYCDLGIKRFHTECNGLMNFNGTTIDKLPFKQKYITFE